MKKLLALIIFTAAASLQADGLSQAWDDLGQYRVVSGVKATVAGIGTVHAVLYAYKAAQATAGVFSDNRPMLKWDKQAWEKWNEVIGGSVCTLGMLYVGAKLGWECFPIYTKHALAIR